MATTIDADTHVDETEETWEYMLPSEAAYKPVVGYPSNPDPKRATQQFWVIDDLRQPRLHRDEQPDDDDGRGAGAARRGG